MPLHQYETRVSFGDCDPAGIVYYPHIFRWVDTSFHDYLWRFGGHGALCQRLGAVGMGLMDAQARFRAPLRNGDRLIVSLIALDWDRRSVGVTYQGHVGATLAFEAREVRGVFTPSESGISAAPVAPLRAVLQGGGHD